MDDQPQQNWADQEQWASGNQPGGNDAGDDLDELEKYFDQKQY
jgi:hypothetical protein